MSAPFDALREYIDDGWLVSKTRCLACLRIQLNIHPIEADEHTLECGHCGACRSSVLTRFCQDGEVIEVGQSERN